MSTRIAWKEHEQAVLLQALIDVMNELKEKRQYQKYQEGLEKKLKHVELKLIRNFVMRMAFRFR